MIHPSCRIEEAGEEDAETIDRRLSRCFDHGQGEYFFVYNIMGI